MIERFLHYNIFYYNCCDRDNNVAIAHIYDENGLMLTLCKECLADWKEAQLEEADADE